MAASNSFLLFPVRYIYMIKKRSIRSTATIGNEIMIMRENPDVCGRDTVEGECDVVGYMVGLIDGYLVGVLVTMVALNVGEDVAQVVPKITCSLLPKSPLVSLISFPL